MCLSDPLISPSSDRMIFIDAINTLISLVALMPHVAYFKFYCWKDIIISLKVILRFDLIYCYRSGNIREGLIFANFTRWTNSRI